MENHIQKLRPIKINYTILNNSKLLWWLLLFSTFLIPISQFLSTRLFFCTLVLSLFVKRYSENLLRQTWPVFLFLLILTAGLIYSEDLPSGFHILETSFSLFSIPIILSGIRNFSENKLNSIGYAFCAGLITACAVCLTNAMINYFQSREASLFFFYSLTSIISLQPTYFAYYLIFAITFGLYQLYYQKGNIKQGIIISALLFCFIMFMLTGSQTTFISMLLVLSFFIMKFLIDEKTKERKIVFALSCLMVVAMFFTSRMLNDNRDTVLTDSWERFVLWESALRANPNWLLGVGTGDGKDILNQYYIEHDLAKYATDSYNAHNQFIQILFTNGILGLIAVIILIARPIYLSVRNNDVLGTLIFFPFIIYGMTEVFLGRYQGIVFFALLHQVFVSYYLSLKPSLAPLKSA